MVQINFVKYNRTRKEEFQIKTTILEENNTRYVEKTALHQQGFPHIWSFAFKYQQLISQHPKLQWLEPTIDRENGVARFAYVKGETLTEWLGNQIIAGEAPIAEIVKIMDVLFAVEEKHLIPFSMTPQFEEVFGNYQGEGVSFGITNVDGLFDNFLISEGIISAIDYEWVFDYPIPLDFIKYRTLIYFYEKYHSIMNYQSAAEFLQQFNLLPPFTAYYDEMEQRFQEYVHGENQEILLGNFMVETKTVTDLARIDRELERTKERLKQVREHVQEKDLTIRKIQEVQRLTNNHVTNLEIIIRDLRCENEEQGKRLFYLNRHEALIFKLKRKLGQKFNQLYPKGTIRRKKMAYVKEFICHPFRSFRLYATKEGKNLIDGDFQIGSIYRTYGRLRFPQVEVPKVSIIIPVYNQIEYTYACLQSILEYTNDVSYEVIIADDLSTDATEFLDRYTENLIISRNQTNQGFLRNCNQAAAKAKGSYLMFLNNDTKVTKGWLSHLVRLLESDSSIGMVGSKLVYADGRLQEAGGIIWSDGSGWNYGRLDQPDKPEYNYVKEVDYISGAAILISHPLWQQIGGFDDRFAPAYCEDSDLAFAVRQAGYRVLYQPLSVVIHFEGISNGTDVEGTGLKRYQIENSKKLREKWALEFQNQCQNNGNPDPFRARERSMGKPIILVVDHYVPTYDKDAGSKTTFQYLKLFLQRGYIVKFLGDNFLHEEPYSTVLQQLGIEILYGQEYQVEIWNWIKDHGNEIAYVYLNRPHIASKYIDYIKENTNIPVIYYGHDLHFLRESREYELTGEVEKLNSAQYWKAVELSLMYKANVSYYPSSIERDAVKEIDAEIPVKNIVAYVYDSFLKDIPTDFSKRQGILFVGGFAHPPNADAVLWFAREIYPLIYQQVKIPFYIVGSKMTDEIRALEQPGNGIVIKGFVSDEELAELYLSCQLVVVPLRYGAGVKGKVIEALYYGAPIVTTSIGAEGIDQAGKIMVIADQVEQFAAEVVALYHDKERCLNLSQKTQEYIKRNFSSDAAWNVIQEDFIIEGGAQICHTDI